MKLTKFKGNVETAYGVTLDKAVPFSGEYEAFETIDEVRAANEVPSNDDVVSIVNAKRKANSRAKATTEALQAAGIEKPTLEDPAVQFANMVKILKVSGKSQEQAEQIAKQVLGQ